MKQIKLMDLLVDTCDYFDVCTSKVRDPKCWHRTVAMARWVFTRLAKDLTLKSTLEISTFLGAPNESTANANLRKFAERAQKQPILSEALEEIGARHQKGKVEDGFHPEKDTED